MTLAPTLKRETGKSLSSKSFEAAGPFINHKKKMTPLSGPNTHLFFLISSASLTTHRERSRN